MTFVLKKIGGKIHRNFCEEIEMLAKKAVNKIQLKLQTHWWMCGGLGQKQGS